jgi:hypothetical protein
MKKSFGLFLSIIIIFLGSFIVISILRFSTSLVYSINYDVLYQKVKIEHDNQIAVIKNEVINLNNIQYDYEIVNNNFISKVKLVDINNLEAFTLYISTFDKNNNFIKVFSKILIEKNNF